ncbi:MAG: hypothetical protein AAGI90_07205, partial [Chlamydiota bacterium]
MKFLYYYGIIFFLLLLFFGRYDPRSEESKLVDAIERRVAKRLRKEYGLYLAVTGAKMMFDIELLRLYFDCYHSADLPTSRKLVVKAADIFLEEINKTEAIRTYLADDPFTTENIELMIFFTQNSQSKEKRDSICVATVNKGGVAYGITTPD